MIDKNVQYMYMIVHVKEDWGRGYYMAMQGYEFYLRVRDTFSTRR